MSDERRLDAAIGLIGLGKVYPHPSHGSDSICDHCGRDVHAEKVCYAVVPEYGKDIKAASELLSEIWKTAQISIHFNNDIKMFEFDYGENNTNASGMKFVSPKAPQAIKGMALYHFNIEPKEVMPDCEKDCCVVNQ